MDLTDAQAAQPDVPLTDTEWVLTTLLEGTGADGTPSSVPAEVRSTLRLDADGRLRVRPGCNSGSGGYRVDGDRFLVEELILTRMACDPPAMLVEQAVVSVLHGDATFRLAGDTLTLERAGTGLVYRAS